MNQTQNFPIKKPVSFWNRPLRADFKDLFKSLTKAALGGVTFNWPEAARNALDAVTAIGFESDPGQTAWLLIYRSTTRAVYKLVEDHFDLIKSSPTAYWHAYGRGGLPSDAVEAITGGLDLSLEECELNIDEGFFREPGELALLREVKRPLAQWLSGLGLTDAQAETVSNKLPRYFVEALTREWHANRHSYACLKEALDTPFTRANDREQAWLRYEAWLQKQTEEPMFYEAFGLRQVYVPLRAYYVEQTDSLSNSRIRDRLMVRSSPERKNKDTMVVVDLDSELELWLAATDPRDAIRVISGGPGSGKSSFAKMFAAKQAAKGERRVLFVPLHRFEPSSDLIDAVGDFVRYERFLAHNPLDPKEGDPRLLIIFDGLDELSMQGKASAEVARHFLTEVQRKLDRLNFPEARVKVLLSGRELSIQAHHSDLRRPRQVLHLLPYYVPSAQASQTVDVYKNYRDEYYDTYGLLLVDQRALWWKAYGAATGRGYAGLPAELRKEALVEVTSQPLLNYLVALSFVRGKLDFKSSSNLNLVYEDLLLGV